MLLSWSVRCVDRRDRTFFDRHLVLVTEDLGPVQRAAVEGCFELCRASQYHPMVTHRHLFKEWAGTDQEMDSLVNELGNFNGFIVHDYFEDEKGIVISSVAEVLTGDPNWVTLPSCKPHDVEYITSNATPIRLDSTVVSPAQLQTLGYFVRDHKELERSALSKEGPGKLSSARGKFELLTAVTDEEIRSFVTIFRRLYMVKERANFVAACEVFATVLGQHPLSRWVRGVVDEYSQALDGPPDIVPALLQQSTPFTVKRLIDVFINTQYAHQPSDQRTRQFEDCLAAVGQQRAVLMWMFLTEMWTLSLHFRNIGSHVSQFLSLYQEHHKVSARVLNSIAEGNPAIGGLETRAQERKRIIDEKVDQLALSMWKDAGEPVGGSEAFKPKAREDLAKHFPV